MNIHNLGYHLVGDILSEELFGIIGLSMCFRIFIVVFRILLYQTARGNEL